MPAADPGDLRPEHQGRRDKAGQGDAQHGLGRDQVARFRHRRLEDVAHHLAVDQHAEGALVVAGRCRHHDQDRRHRALKPAGAEDFKGQDRQREDGGREQGELQRAVAEDVGHPHPEPGVQHGQHIGGNDQGQHGLPDHGAAQAKGRGKGLVGHGGFHRLKTGLTAQARPWKAAGGLPSPCPACRAGPAPSPSPRTLQQPCSCPLAWPFFAG